MQTIHDIRGQWSEAMNNNRISRTNNLDLQSLIRRCDIKFDARARYVEFVCSIWNEGRFGPDLAAPITVDQPDRPDREPVSFLDLDGCGQCWPDRLHGSAGCCALSILGRTRLQAVAAAIQLSKQMCLLNAGPNAHYSTPAITPNQGRGSP